METSPPPHKETKTIELGTIKLNVAANGNTHVILSKKSEIREKIKEFAEEKTGKNIRTPYYLDDLKYDEEKNTPYYELIEKEDNKEDTFSYYDSIGKDIYKLYIQTNYYYSDERAENPEKYNINTLIEDVKRNNPEITNIEVLSTQSLPFGKTSEDNIDDYDYSSKGKRYILANVTKNGITTETKIIFREQIPRGYDLFKINENDFKERMLSEETKNKINEILSKYNNIYYDKYTYTLASDKLETDQNDFTHYISINAYNKDTNKTELKKYIVEKPNFSENINVDNLKINDQIFYFNDNDLKNLSYNYNKIYFERQNKNNQNTYKLFFENKNDNGISTILEKLNKNKSENEKISVYDIIKIKKDSDTYLILKLSNNELHTIKFSKFNFPNIKIDVSGNQLTDENRHQINKVLKHLYNYNDIDYFKDLDVINENGKISLKFKGNFYYKDIQSTIRLNKLNNENFEIIDPEDIPEYGENCSKRLKIIIPNIDDIPNEENCIPNKPNDPITPSNIPSNPKPNGGGITPKQNKPNTPNTVIPKESNTTPNKPSESTPVTIINKTENKNDVGESQFATTLPKQDIPQSEITRNIKTGDIIFVINMIMIFTIFILTVYMNFEKDKIFKINKKD